MSEVRATAPGKVVLAGEYAVLDGAPAIAMAVDRRATVVIPAQGRDDRGGDRRLLEAVCAQLDIDSREIRLDQDTSAFFARASNGGTEKLGIGSSAALCAALCAALAPPDYGGEALFRTSLAAHQEFQGGVGSGVDVATSIAGGLVRYRLEEPGPIRLQWPDGLSFALLWSRVPSDTVEKLRRLRGLKPAQSAGELCRAATDIADAWLEADATALLSEYRRYTEVLRRYDSDHELGIFSAGHATQVRRAAGTDVVYKPCGAGGGDIGIALSLDEHSLGEFVLKARDCGFVPLDLAIDLLGAERHGESS